MTVFEFVFALYSVLFGLALAEVFGGFGNMLQERHKLKVGWLTPLLGLFVIFDLTSFWEIGWQMRGITRPYFLFLIACVLVAGIYYLAARLVFPRNFVEWPDFDVYYFEHRRIVIGGVVLCNILATMAQTALGYYWWQGTWGRVNFVLFYGSFAALMLARSKRANLALLAFTLVQYPVVSFIEFMSQGGH